LDTQNAKKEFSKLSSEQLFNIYLECQNPQAPVKDILEQHGLKPWDLVAIRKIVKEGALTALSSKGKRGRKTKTISLEDFERTNKELLETKDALAAIGHQFSLLKKRVD
jgi:hypothetical protein